LVYLFGRDDFTVQLYGANVYPENIKEALEDRRIQSLVSGKFIIETKNGRNMTPYLALRIELASGIKPDKSLLLLMRQVVVETLQTKNSEYNVIFNTIGKRAEPKLKLESYGSKWFKFDIKHKWVKRVQ